MQRGVIDALLDMLQLTPFRCNSCNHRFFRFRQRWARVVIPLSLLLVLTGSTFISVKAVPWLRGVKRSLTRLPPEKPTSPRDSRPLDSRAVDLELYPTKPSTELRPGAPAPVPLQLPLQGSADRNVELRAPAPSAAPMRAIPLQAKPVKH